MVYAYLFWPLSVLLLSWAEAGLVPALRKYVPADSPEARAAVAALHQRLTWLYCLPVAMAPWLPLPWWKWAMVAMVARLAFDVLLNLFCGVPALYVGQTAASDKFIRKLAPNHPERFALVARLTATAAAGWLVWRG